MPTTSFAVPGGAAGRLPRLAARAQHAPWAERLALGRADRLGRRDLHLVHSPVIAGIAALAGTARTHDGSRARRRRHRKPGYNGKRRQTDAAGPAAARRGGGGDVRGDLAATL